MRDQEEDGVIITLLYIERMAVVLETRSLRRGAESDRLVLEYFLSILLVQTCVCVTNKNSEPELKDVAKIPLLFHGIDRTQISRCPIFFFS